MVVVSLCGLCVCVIPRVRIAKYFYLPLGCIRSKFYYLYMREEVNCVCVCVVGGKNS